MKEFFEKTFYSNTITDWLIAFGIIVGAIVLAKIVYWIFGRFIKKLTSRTKSKLDDIIVDMIEEPIIFALIIAGVWYGLNTLNMSPGVTDFLQKVYYVLIIINIAWLFARLIDALIEEYLVPLVEKSDSSLDDQLLPILRKAIRITIWVIAIIVALNNAGYDVGAVIAGLGIGGLAFALAAQDTVSNLFGSFTIFMDKPFTIGDRIEVAGFDGFVEEIGIRTTKLRQLDGRRVVIPNSKVANESIINISSEPSRKVVLNLGMVYETTPPQMELAMQLVKDVAETIDDLVEKTPPEGEEESEEYKDKKMPKNVLVSFNAFGDFAMNILVIYWIKPEGNILETFTKMNLGILKAFNENGLEFAFPTQTIYKKELP